jgi:nitrate reductase gamma subunit
MFLFMIFFIYASYLALFFCLTSSFIHFIKLVKLGAPKEFSEEAGNISAGVLYSNTGAMLPKQKESAYKHLPTYTAGAFFHIGSFIALISFFVLIFDMFTSDAVSIFLFQKIIIPGLIALCLWISSFCGVGLFIKRVISKKLRPISNADDYISVLLVVLFQIISAILFTIYAFHFNFHNYFSHAAHNTIFCLYFLSATLLFIYLPFGKLRHTVYYFAARYHLGFFYGRRGTWPPKSKL